jgi:hypothetical protein
MHTSQQQVHTFSISTTHPLKEDTQATKMEGNVEEKIYVNMTKEQHEKMYAEFIMKKTAYKRTRIAKHRFQERVGEIRGQYVEPSILEEMKEKTKDDSIKKRYEEVLGKEDQKSEKIAAMTIRDVIELFTSNKMENNIDQLDFTNILPDDKKDTKYCISYFMAFLKNGKTELLPFIVKMNIQDVITYETEVEQIKKDSESDITIWRYLLSEGVEIKPEQKQIHNRSTCEKIKKKMNLIQKASKFQYDSNDLFFFQYICDSLRFYEKEEEKIKKNIIPQLKKILCESSKPSFYWVDTELIYHFYQLYLNMYGSDNVDSIEFIWNCEEKEIKENYFYIPNMKLMHDEIRKEDFQESEFETISKYSIEDYCFTLNEIFDFKDHFPFKLENSLLYSFGAEMETDNILQMISEYLKFNQMKKEFKENFLGAYKSACRNKWIDDICSHMILKEIPNGYWCKERCIQEGKKFKHRTEFQKKSKGAYKACLRNNWLEEVCEHMIYKVKPSNYWTYEKCLEVKNKCNTQKEFRDNFGGAYASSYRNHWLDEFFPKPIKS